MVERTACYAPRPDRQAAWPLPLATVSPPPPPPPPPNTWAHATPTHPPCCRYVWRMLERSMDLPLGQGPQVGAHARQLGGQPPTKAV